MPRRRIYEDHRLTDIEKGRRQQDKAVTIDDKLDAAFDLIDWERRNEAEKSLEKWVMTYCVPLMLNDPPSANGLEVLKQMEDAITSHSNYMICMPRGFGKTSLIECCTLYALATGLQKYVVVISNNARAANGIMTDIWRGIAETGTAFAQDYPHICFPFHVCNGSFRRRQLYHGRSTDIQKNASNIVFATLHDEEGNEMPSSGSILTCRGVTSGLRGMKFGKLRPTLALLDDLQSSETAENPEAVDKLMQTIRKDIMPLAGKERLSILQTATPICTDDLVQKIKDDHNWNTTIFKGIIHYPRSMDLWKQYFQLFDAELVAGTKHTKSLDFYKSNRVAMDEGSEVFDPQRYSTKDGHISAIQKLLEIEHMIGESAFQSEYQMSPKRISFAIDITPKIISSRVNTFEHLEVPDGFTFVSASTDLNTSYAATIAIQAFKRDMTSVVIHHEVWPCNIDQKLNDTEYSNSVYSMLVQIGQHLKSLNVKIDGWAIDCGGRQWDAVTQFAKNASHLVGLPACAFAGKASHVFNPYIRTRLRDAIGKTVLCGDSAEQTKSGSGTKYCFFDSDFYRVMAQKAFLSEVLAPGSCSLYKGDDREHTEFALQICNEKLKHIKHHSNGRDQYFYNSKDPHDYLDCMSMNFAVAASQGLSGTAGNTSSRQNAGMIHKKIVKHRKIKFV